MRSIRAEPDHIPYRRSKLTMLLKDCFTHPKVLTVFLAHVAPTARSAEYTKNTLDYASQVLMHCSRTGWSNSFE